MLKQIADPDHGQDASLQMAKQNVERTWRIYKITCLITQKSYIGLTVDTVSQRWSNHVCQARIPKKSILHRAINKYGRAAFVMEILCEVTSFDAACAAEREAIVYHETIVPGGYNIAHGGAGAPGVSRPHLIETRLKISASHKGKVFSAETRAKMSAAKKKIGMSRKAIEASAALRIGKPLPLEVRNKVSLSHTGKIRPLRSIALLKRCLSDPLSNSGIHKEHNRFHVRIGIHGKRTYVGIFDTIDDARLAHRAAVRKRIAELESAH
jgi:group I intron endonuclease